IEVPGEIGDLLLGTRPAPLVVVGSRKGGVGKTALSAGLAQVAGYSLDGRAGVAALVDQNINNADQWGRLMLPPGVTTVRELMAQLEQGKDFPGAPAYARTPALAVFPESRDPGDGYPPVLIERFAKDLRARYVFTVIDLPNALPAFTSAESSVAASYIAQADLVLVPTTDDPNALRGALEYLGSPSVRQKAAIVPYIVSPERGIRDHPKVLELVDQIRERAVAVVPFPKTEKATLAVVKGASVLDVDTRLRNAYIDLASAVARVLVRGI
ncbi:MAG: ParA family protein, partial [Candidatus Dormibacteraceae bacterium]